MRELIREELKGIFGGIIDVRASESIEWVSKHVDNPAQDPLKDGLSR